MKVTGLVIILFCYLTSGRLPESYHRSCGVDLNKLPSHEGITNIEYYPWLGLLYYPVNLNDDIVTAAVVLITYRMVLASALDIDQYPKENFRALARVVLGANCSGNYLLVKDYAYHPDFNKYSYSALAIVQLDITHNTPVLHPICWPPWDHIRGDVFALYLKQDCRSESVTIHRMLYVDPNECKQFYRNIDLGIGVNGPGCEAPARFLDYGMYHSWVKQKLDNIGKPAITRIGPGLIILRRSVDGIQRYGTCDKGELQNVLSDDFLSIESHTPDEKSVTYNLPLSPKVDYTCVILHAYSDPEEAQPIMRLERVCPDGIPHCWSYENILLNFKVEISYRGSFTYDLKAYGQEVNLVDLKSYRSYLNRLYNGEESRIPDKDANYSYVSDVFVTSKPLYEKSLL